MHQKLQKRQNLKKGNKIYQIAGYGLPVLLSVINPVEVPETSPNRSKILSWKLFLRE